MTFRVVLIEDEDRDSLRHTIQELGGGDFEVVAFPPPSDLDLTQVLDADGDLYMVDYELDTRQPDDSIANYRGTTLTARLRELISEYPIILLTRSELPSWTSRASGCNTRRYIRFRSVQGHGPTVFPRSSQRNTVITGQRLQRASGKERANRI